MLTTDDIDAIAAIVAAHEYVADTDAIGHCSADDAPDVTPWQHVSHVTDMIMEVYGS